MRQLLRRLSYLIHRRRLEREMAEEMAYHREQMAADRRTQFGDDLRLREDAREMWGWTWLDRLQQDLSYGVRVLRGAPGFTITAVLVLVLGIGVPLTAVRMVVADVPGISAPDPDTLVQLTRRSGNAHTTSLTYPELAFYSANATSFREVIGVSQFNPMTFSVARGEAPERIDVTLVTANYFAEFGVSVALGRTLAPFDERPGAETVALLDASFWQRRLGGDPSIVGQHVHVNGVPVRVIGVLPQTTQSRAHVWMPLAQEPAVVPGSTMLTGWNSALTAYARLASGVTPESSQHETRVLARSLRERWPDRIMDGEFLEARPILQFDANSDAWALWLTAGALVLLLLVAACANLGTLVLARGAAREREIRVRMALGAGRLRIVRQLFTESLLLAVVSGAAALFLSTLVLKVIQVRLATTSLIPDWRVVLATFAAALLAALVFGLPSAIRLASQRPHAGRSRRVFLSTQVAVSCLLLVLSSLLVDSRTRAAEIDPGFDYEHLLWVSPGLVRHGYDAPAAQAYFEQLRARVGALPGVTHTSQAYLGPWDAMHVGARWQGRDFTGNQVDESFLGTMGIELLRGRNLRPGERGVALVNEAAAHALWPGEDPLGRTLPWGPPGQSIVGLVRNASTRDVGVPRSLEYYQPTNAPEVPDSVLIVRVSGAPRDYVRTLEAEARGLDTRLQPSVLVASQTFDGAMATAIEALAAIAGLGVIANLLSIVGLAGLASYTVVQRAREIAVRIALGAGPVDVVRSILAPMQRSLLVGFLFGAAGGAACALVLRTSIPTMASLQVTRPLPYMLALVAFGAVVALAVLSPSRRAIRVDPLGALKGE